MQKVNALQLRQSLGKVLRKLEKTGEPILVEKNREPKAVMITLEDFRKGHFPQPSAEERKQIFKRIDEFRKTVKVREDAPDTLTILRQLRGPLP